MNSEAALDTGVVAGEPAAIQEPSCLSYASDDIGALRSLAIWAVEQLSGQRHIKRLYDRRAERGRPAELFWQDAIEGLELDLVLNREPRQAIPSSGPLVIVANHPFGVVDGLILCWLVSAVRSDFKIMTHNALYRVPEARPHIIPVDFSGTMEALDTNIRGRRMAKAILSEGGALIVFPSGAVASSKGFFGPAVDGPWGTFAAKLMLGTGASALPIFFAGQNSRLSQIAANLNPTLKLSLLFHEVRNKIGARIAITLRDPIAIAELRSLGDQRAVTEHLRRVTLGAG